MNQRITDYIRGKVLEIMVVGVAIWLDFLLFDLDYSLLLAVLVGFPVLIPHIGAFTATIPVTGATPFQFGLGTEFWSCFTVYLITQALDGNLLIPVLFSEAVNLHPLVIILSVVIFDGLRGSWGVSFTISLATLVKAVMHVWPDGQVVGGLQSARSDDITSPDLNLSNPYPFFPDNPLWYRFSPCLSLT